MPDGVVQWFDPATGRAAIVRAGHVYAAGSADLEPHARHAGAHVHFDIRRDEGAERAVDVRLRAGTRVSHRQGRFGTLVGARRSDTKGPAPFARAHPERGRMLAIHPLELVRSWVECVQQRDLDGALSLYASDAIVHAAGDEHVGRSHVGSYLEASPMFGNGPVPDIRGEDGTVVVHWVADATTTVVVQTRVAHGLIAEQWVGQVPRAEREVELARTASTTPIAVAVRTGAGVGDDQVDYALTRVGAVLRHLDDPVLFARLELELARDRARTKPALAQVTVDVNGDVMRAHVAAHTLREAADLLERRLNDKLDQRAQHRDDRRTRSAAHDPGEWRHGDLPTARPDHYDRPVGERQLVRHNTFAIDELTPDEAAYDMEQLDYDFYLFRDLASGEDAVLEMRPGGGYRLTRLHPTAVESVPTAIPVAISHIDVPELTVVEATQRLDTDGEPFVFFANATTGRGNVVYRRYDGHYGLITPG